MIVQLNMAALWLFPLMTSMLCDWFMGDKDQLIITVNDRCHLKER